MNMTVSIRNDYRNFKHDASFDIQTLHRKALDLLNDVVFILNKHNVKYWLDHGTLLGATRENKFIPWDGDIDLGVSYDHFMQIDEFYKELEDKGLMAEHALDFFMIMRKDWDVGYFRVHLHIYRKKGNHYTCSFVQEKRGILKHALFKMKELFQCFDNIERIKYYRHKEIAYALLSSGIPPDRWNSIGFMKGRFNIKESFILKMPDFYIISNPIKNIIKNPLMYKFILNLFAIFPDRLIHFFHKLLCRLTKPEYTSSHVMKVNSEHYDNLSKQTLYNKTFSAPNKPEKYLESIYGKNWKVPDMKWKRANMDHISMRGEE